MKMMPSFEFEQHYSGIVAGIDEAGCGPWAGPVVASACIFLNQNQQMSLLDLINDSKVLTKKKREIIFQQLIELPSHQFCYGVGLASVDEIDQMNIGKATRLAMQRAVDCLPVSPESRGPVLKGPVFPASYGETVAPPPYRRA